MNRYENESFVELHITFRTSLVIRLSNEDFDEYDYVRRFTGHIESVVGEQEKRTDIGEIEVWYIDGTRAQANNLNIVEICDAVSQEEYSYAESVFTNGKLDYSVVGDTFSQDVMVLHQISILPDFRGRKYGLKVTEKLIETMGVQCGAILLHPAPLQFSIQENNVEWKQRMRVELFCQDEKEATTKLSSYWNTLGLLPTKNPDIYLVEIRQ